MDALHASGLIGSNQQVEQQLHLLKWLKLPTADLEERFHQDASVLRTLAFIDTTACLQSIVMNWQLIRRFGWAQLGWHSLHLEDQALLPHEQVLCFMCSVLAVLQLLMLLLRPSSYLRSRHRFALFNRLLRLTIVLLSVVMLTPAEAKRQVEVLLTSALGVNISTVQASTSRAQGGWTATNTTHLGSAGGTSAFAAHAAAAAGSTAHAATAAGSATAPVTLTAMALIKAFFAHPLVYFNHANHVVDFRLVVCLQLVTCLATVSMDIQRLCVSMPYAQASTAAVVPVCKDLSWAIQSLGHLLDVQLPAVPDDLAASRDSMCDHPLAALLLIKVWAHVVLLVVLPCAAIYSLELSLKARFLQNQAAAATTAAAAAAATGASRPHAALGRPFFEHTAGPGQQQVVSASPPEAAARSTGQAQQQDRSHQRDRGQALAEALTQIEPLRPASFMLPGAEAAVWRGIFLLGLMLGVAMGCWYVSELGILLVMRSGRQLVCDAEGWLRLV